MNPELHEFIEKSRHHHKTDDEIRQNLVAAGWDEHQVVQALQGGEDIAVPAPPTNQLKNHSDISQPSSTHAPISVVENLSPRGFEYNIMFITLWLTAIAAVIMINIFLYGEGLESAKFPLTILIVSLPVFGFMFYRLKQAETAEPRLLFDPSRRKSVQSTQRTAFIILLIQTIFTLYAFIEGADEVESGKIVVSWLLSVVVFGGIFAYYWKNTPRTE